jgi:hypothetical protein
MILLENHLRLWSIIYVMATYVVTVALMFFLKISKVPDMCGMIMIVIGSFYLGLMNIVIQYNKRVQARTLIKEN